MLFGWNNLMFWQIICHQKHYLYRFCAPRLKFLMTMSCPHSKQQVFMEHHMHKTCLMSKWQLYGTWWEEVYKESNKYKIKKKCWLKLLLIKLNWIVYWICKNGQIRKQWIMNQKDSQLYLYCLLHWLASGVTLF